MHPPAVWRAPWFVLFACPLLLAQPRTGPELERAAERRYRSAEQFYGGGRYAQAIRDFEAILEVMPESRLADDAALRIARHRFEVEGDLAAATAMVGRLLGEFPAGNAVPGAHLLLGRIAAADSPPRPDDALAEFERVLTAGDPSGSPWAFAALAGIARVLSDRGDDEGAAGALLAALYETATPSGHVRDRFHTRLQLARVLARGGEREGALGEIAGLRADLLREARQVGAGSAENGPGAEGVGEAELLQLAERAAALSALIFRFRGSVSPQWEFAGSVRPPRPLDEPRRLRAAEGLLYLLDRDRKEVQVFRPSGEFTEAYGTDDPWDLDLVPGGSSSASPLLVSGEMLVIAGNSLSLSVPDARGRSERLRRLRAAAVVPEGFWVWDSRQKTVLRFTRSGDYLGRVPHPRLDEVLRVARHPAGHLLVIEEDEGVLGFDAEGKRIFHIPRERGRQEPVDLVFDDLGNLYVLDRSGPSLAVHARDFDSLALLRGGEWSGGAIRRPVSLTVGSDGTLFVLDEATRSVGVFR